MERDTNPIKKQKRVQGKYGIELNIVGNKTWLNFWDYVHGNDVVVRVRGDGLWIGGKKITIHEYITRVRKSIKARKLTSNE